MNVSKSALKGSLVGVVASTVVLLSVYEGKVLFANEGGQLSLQPGDTAKAEKGYAPKLVSQNANEMVLDTRSSEEKELQKSNELLRKKIAILETLFEKIQGDLLKSLSASDYFSLEERDPIWAPKQEEMLQEKLTRYLNLSEELFSLECHKTCCEIHLDEEKVSEGVWAKAMQDMQSGIGLQHQFNGAQFGPYQTMSFCFDTEKETILFPDRGLEREALLDRLKPQIASCTQSLETLLILDIKVDIDEDGLISSLKIKENPPEYTNSLEIARDRARYNLIREEQPQHPVANCVAQAILDSAKFANAPKATFIPMSFRLEPTSK